LALTHKKDLRDSSENIENGPDLTVHRSVADTLCLARQEHGQELSTVAQVLRIRLVYLEAIEAGDFDSLPGTAYAIGFLRTYAEFLGLDGDEIVERFKNEVHSVEPKLDLVFPEPVGQNRIPGGAIILISALLLGLAYGGWFYLSNEGKSVADLIPPLPERLQALLDSAVGGADEAVPAEMKTGSETVQAQAYTPPENAEAEVEADSPAPLAASGQAEVTDFEMAVESEPAAEDEPAGSVAAVEEAPDTPAEPDSATTIAEPAPAEPEPVPATQAEPQAEATASGEVSATPVSPEPAQTTDLQSALQTTSQPAMLRPVAAPSAPAYDEFSRAGSTSVASIEPLLDETVVIPAPPAAPHTMSLSTDRSPRIYGESNEDTRVVLRALQDSWVQVRDARGALLLTRVLRAGDIYYVPQRSGLTLLTGNAGGLEIAVDGVTVSPLGPIGAVRRQIALDPTLLLAGTAQAR
jgi:cytoskeletal protein RodZ